MPATRSPLVAAFASLSLLVAALVQAPAAQAEADFSVSSTIVGSKCSSQENPMRWRGGLPEGVGVSPKKWPTGTVYVCYYKYKLKSDRHADYYAVSLESHWRHTAGSRTFPAEMQQVVISSVAAIDNVYKATNDFSTKADDDWCDTPFSVSFGVGPISVSTSPILCRSYSVNRDLLSNKQAFWKSAKAGGLRQVDTAFVQKVPKGVVPKYDITFAIPQYKNTWSEASQSYNSQPDFRYFTWQDR